MSYNECIEYFELQVQNFMKDFETKEKNADGIYVYHPQYLPDIDEMILSCGLDEDNCTLADIRDIIACYANFNDWNELIHANEFRLKLGKMLFEYRQDSDDEYSLLDSWQAYEMCLAGFDDEAKLGIFEAVFLGNEDDEEDEF